MKIAVFIWITVFLALFLSIAFPLSKDIEPMQNTPIISKDERENVLLNMCFPDGVYDGSANKLCSKLKRHIEKKLNGE